jgi:hypothetical protein
MQDIFIILKPKKRVTYMIRDENSSFLFFHCHKMKFLKKTMKNCHKHTKLDTPRPKDKLKASLSTTDARQLNAEF